MAVDRNVLWQLLLRQSWVPACDSKFSSGAHIYDEETSSQKEEEEGEEGEERENRQIEKPGQGRSSDAVRKYSHTHKTEPERKIEKDDDDEKDKHGKLKHGNVRQIKVLVAC